MVVKHDNKQEQPHEKTAKERLLEVFEDESEVIISLAYMYAKGIELCGDDVTKRWQTAALQTDALNRAFRKGYEDAIAYMLESTKYEQYHDWIEKNMKGNEEDG